MALIESLTADLAARESGVCEELCAKRVVA